MEHLEFLLELSLYEQIKINLTSKIVPYKEDQSNVSKWYGWIILISSYQTIYMIFSDGDKELKKTVALLLNQYRCVYKLSEPYTYVFR